MSREGQLFVVVEVMLTEALEGYRSACARDDVSEQMAYWYIYKVGWEMLRDEGLLGEMNSEIAGAEPYSLLSRHDRAGEH